MLFHANVPSPLKGPRNCPRQGVIAHKARPNYLLFLGESYRFISDTRTCSNATRGCWEQTQNTAYCQYNQNRRISALSQAALPGSPDSTMPKLTSPNTTSEHQQNQQLQTPWFMQISQETNRIYQKNPRKQQEPSGKTKQSS